LDPEEAYKLKDMYLKIREHLIIIDKCWLHRFTQKYNLSYRRITHISPKIHLGVENDVLSFLNEVHQLRIQLDIPPEMILNFDETAIFYDQLPTYSYFKVGEKHPAIKVSNVQKKRLTAGLCITASGEKLKPILIFKGDGVRFRKLNNTKNYLLKKNTNAWMTLKIFSEYIKYVVKPYVEFQRLKPELKDKKALLIIDNFAGHKIDEEEKKKLEDFGIILKYLRPYTTHVCQPLDLSINYLLKKSMKDKWVFWFDKNQENSKAPTKQEIYDSFTESWGSITPLHIIKAFLSSGISNNVNGEEDVLSKNLIKLRSSQNSYLAAEVQETESQFYNDPYFDFEDYEGDQREQEGYGYFIEKAIVENIEEVNEENQIKLTEDKYLT